MRVRHKQQLRGERVAEDDVGQLLAAIAAPAEVGDVGEAIGVTSGLGRRMSSPIVRLPPLVRALRPLQWTKNVVVLAALVFSGELFVVGSLARAAAATLVFCCASSAMYLVNSGPRSKRGVALSRTGQAHPERLRRKLPGAAV